MSDEEKCLLATVSNLTGLDIRQVINHLKSNLHDDDAAFGLELFLRHSQTIRTVQELILVVTLETDTDDKAEDKREALEGLLNDVCLPFLSEFCPSYDGRTELSAAVLIVCDLAAACLQWSSHNMTVKVLSLCLQSLTTFHQEFSHHSSDSLNTLDIVCALELLRVTLEVANIHQNNQNDDICDEIFSLSLAILPDLNDKMANRLVTFVIMKLTQQLPKNRDVYLYKIWNCVASDVTEKPSLDPMKRMSSKTLQRHLSLVCSMANFFFPLSGETAKPDIRCADSFWILVQQGLYDENPAVRKRALYLLKRIIDTCDKSRSDLNLPVFSSTNTPVVPVFWWEKDMQSDLSKIWEDFILILETLDEKQTHVIKPILPRMQSLCLASSWKNGRVLLHTSWLVTLLMRAFHHESTYIVRWAAETVLYMDFTSVPMLQQGQQQFLTLQLLGFLQDLKLYIRPDGSSVGSCSPVGLGLQHFFNSCCAALPNREEKAEFLQHVLTALIKCNWASVPLVFISQGLSCIAPSPIFCAKVLMMIREVIIASLTTLENFTRGAIECFLTKAVLNLVDKERVSVEELMDTLAVLEREESFQRGTQHWAAVVFWLKNTDKMPVAPDWTLAGLQQSLTSMVESYLKITSDMSGTVLAESMRVTKLARFLVLMADCGLNSATAETAAQKPGVSVLRSTLAHAVDTISTINSRAYMPTLKADRAIYLLLTTAKEMGTGSKECPLLKEMCDIISSCWGELLLFVQMRLFCNTGDDQEVDLDLVIFFADAVKTLGFSLMSGAIAGLQSFTASCLKRLPALKAHAPTAACSALHQVSAMSLLAAVAQIVDRQLLAAKFGHSESSGDNSELLGLSQYLWQVCSSLSLGCDIFTQTDRGGSAQRGRYVSQYMESLWKCLHLLASHQPDKSQSPRILDAALDAFSISSGESDIPIMQCLELILRQAKELVDEEKIVEVCQVALSKVQEEIKSWSYWLKMEAFISMALQPSLLASPSDTVLGTYLSQLLQTLFEIGAEKSGTLNLVMSRLCQLWQGSEGVVLAQQMVSTIVDACMFGTVHKKAERLWPDVCMYIESLKKECSVNEILSWSQKNDMYVRLMVINFLSTLKPDIASHRVLGLSVLQEVWRQYLPLAQRSTFRQYTNSLHHRYKHRLLSLIPLLGQFISEDTCQESWKNAWQGLVLECHPSVRHNLEWLVLQLAHRFPHFLGQLWDYFSQFSSKRNVSLCSLLNIIPHLGPELSQDLQEQFYLQAIPMVLPWTMAHHFNTRLHGQACLMKLWQQCQDLQLTAVLGKHSIVHNCLQFTMENSNSCTVVLKLLDNYFYGCFHFLRDFSMETLFYTLPRLACISDDEWISPDVFSQWDKSWEEESTSHSLPLYNSTQTLAACQPGPWRMKAQAENEEDICESTDGDVQKKIIPWRLMTPDSHAEQEYSYRKKGRKPGGLVLVTSMINKLPNLGGLCRTAEIFGVSEFVIGNLSYLSDHTFQSLSVTAEKWIPITEVPALRLSEYLEEKKRESYTLVGVEQTANSVDVTKYSFPKKSLLLLGNEKEGIPPDLLQQLDVCVEIPQQGIIRSLNVHVSGAILVWEYTRQQMQAS